MRRSRIARRHHRCICVSADQPPGPPTQSLLLLHQTGEHTEMTFSVARHVLPSPAQRQPMPPAARTSLAGQARRRPCISSLLLADLKLRQQRIFRGFQHFPRRRGQDAFPSSYAYRSPWLVGRAQVSERGRTISSYPGPARRAESANLDRTGETVEILISAVNATYAMLVSVLTI